MNYKQEIKTLNKLHIYKNTPFCNEEGGGGKLELKASKKLKLKAFKISYKISEKRESSKIEDERKSIENMIKNRYPN